jgi:hypothetical protein
MNNYKVIKTGSLFEVINSRNGEVQSVWSSLVAARNVALKLNA